MVEALVKELALTQHLLGRIQREEENCCGDESGLSGLNVAQDRIVRAVYYLEPCLLSDVAGYASLSMPAASIAIKKLASLGVLETVRDKEDRRKLVIKLSTRVRDIFSARDKLFMNRLRSAWADCDEVILSGLLEELKLINSKLEN